MNCFQCIAVALPKNDTVSSLFYNYTVYVTNLLTEHTNVF